VILPPSVTHAAHGGILVDSASGSGKHPEICGKYLSYSCGLFESPVTLSIHRRINIFDGEEPEHLGHRLARNASRPVPLTARVHSTCQIAVAIRTEVFSAMLRTVARCRPSTSQYQIKECSPTQTIPFAKHFSSTCETGP